MTANTKKNYAKFLADTLKLIRSIQRNETAPATNGNGLREVVILAGTTDNQLTNAISCAEAMERGEEPSL